MAMTVPQYHPATLALQGLFGLANETEREIARGMGLNLTDFRALSALSQSGPVTVGQLAEDLGATPATTTAIVSRLESRGYLERHRGTEDRRRVQVSVTPAATSEIAAVMRPLMTAADNHITSLPDDHKTVIADFLEVARHLMQDHLNALSTKDAP
ncbi:MarR family winged helix-turn-helix transcriptional regulator [Arthrobacter sp. EPSL27]|uniref:MarR family winged helix-turn-helix transcriptional regulator n=1 Tax=Arthrobacter sp. EPSL27 TaxID=1745378 RepID=UPI001E370BEB|nr:MarR family transcriptional regulator [Arthrobacter sp. EPSL27]